MRYERRQVRRSLEKAGQAAFLALGMGFASLIRLRCELLFHLLPDGIGIDLIGVPSEFG
jgi:hypothetical protein